jgi:SNF2 family DNA or RNA helicase
MLQAIDSFLTRCNLAPFEHQVEGIYELVHDTNPGKGRVIPNVFALFDEMGAGKTLQAIIAAQILFEQNKIDRVLIIAPAAVKSVWYHPEFGELRKHLWPDVPVWVTEYHAKRRQWQQGLNPGRADKRVLKWIITNYDFIRSAERRAVLNQICSRRTFLIVDESSAVKNPSAKQTKATQELRGRSGRVAILNGTPIVNHVGDLYSQFATLDPKILGCKNFWVFRARYAKMGGWQGRQILGWHDIEEIQQKLAPYILRRLKKDCIDLPEKLESVPVIVSLTQRTWSIYKDMKEDMVAWLTENSMASAQQTIVRILRLSQITSGFVGGVQVGDVDYAEATDGSEAPAIGLQTNITEKISSEKEDLVVSLFESWLEDDPNIKLLIWCRFRAQLDAIFARLNSSGTIAVGKLHGGQKRSDRDHAIQLLDPRTSPSGPVVVVGTPATGAMGLNLTAAHTVVYVSKDYNLKTRLQSEDRVHRPGQVSDVSYFDIIAEGPNGQKTIDHVIMKALKNKQNLAEMTTAAWVSELRD